MLLLQVMRVSKSGTRQLVTDNLGSVFTLTQHDGASNVQVKKSTHQKPVSIYSKYIFKLLVSYFWPSKCLILLQVTSCSKAFGYCASKHLKLVLDKLEHLLMTEGSVKRSRSSSFFNLLKMDTKSETDQIYARYGPFVLPNK